VKGECGVNECRRDVLDNVINVLEGKVFSLRRVFVEEDERGRQCGSGRE